MEDNRNFATFFADAPKGKKIGAVLSWIATAILLVALFVPGFQMNFEKKDQNGKWKTISEKTDAYDYETAKESWAIKIQLHASAESEKLTDFLDSGKTNVLNYLTDGELMNAAPTALNQDGNIINEPSSKKGKDYTGIILLVVFVGLLIGATVAGVYTVNMVSFGVNLMAVLELVVIYLQFFKKRLFLNAIEPLSQSRLNPVMTMLLIALLVAALALSVAAVVADYVIPSDEESEDGFDEDDDAPQNAPTGLFDGPETGSSTSASAVAATLIQMNTGKSFAILNNTEIVLGKGSQANIIVSNPIISRAHAKISCHNGTCTIRDLDSKNGTFVGDQKISGNDVVVLTDGMYITLGNEIFQFKI